MGHTLSDNRLIATDAWVEGKASFDASMPSHGVSIILHAATLLHSPSRIDKLEMANEQPEGTIAMNGKANDGQSGGVNISGSVGSVGGDIVGRDKTTVAPSAAELDSALHPLAEAAGAASPEKRAEAQAKLSALKQEAAKGEDANDSVVAKLIEGFVGLIPEAAGAVVSAFTTPILGAIAGPVTSYVLDRFRGA